MFGRSEIGCLTVWLPAMLNVSAVLGGLSFGLTALGHLRPGPVYAWVASVDSHRTYQLSKAVALNFQVLGQSAGRRRWTSGACRKAASCRKRNVSHGCAKAANTAPNLHYCAGAVLQAT